MYSGTVAQVLNPVHRSNAHLKGIYLNLFQPKHDYYLSCVARRMRKARVIQDTFVSLSGFTIIVQNEKKTAVQSLGDLKPFVASKGKTIEEFTFNKDFSKDRMDTS